MSKLQRVRPGQEVRPRATTWNAFVDAANYVAQQQTGSPPIKADRWWRVKITGATRDGSNWRWTYTVVRVKWAGGFDDDEITGEFDAYNDVERPNDDDAGGVQSGILLDTEVTGIQPIPTDTVVWARLETDPALAGAFFFALPNAPVVECEEE